MDVDLCTMVNCCFQKDRLSTITFDTILAMVLTGTVDHKVNTISLKTQELDLVSLDTITGVAQTTAMLWVVNLSGVAILDISSDFTSETMTQIDQEVHGVLGLLAGVSEQAIAVQMEATETATVTPPLAIGKDMVQTTQKSTVQLCSSETRRR